MTSFDALTVDRIRTIADDLQMEPIVAENAIKLYNDATSCVEMNNLRIRQNSLAVACVWVSMRLHSNKRIRQDDFAYCFDVTTMTIRKVSKTLCSVLNIDSAKLKVKPGRPSGVTNAG